jgi:hypothetical protein
MDRPGISGRSSINRGRCLRRGPRAGFPPGARVQCRRVVRPRGHYADLPARPKFSQSRWRTFRQWRQPSRIRLDVAPKALGNRQYERPIYPRAIGRSIRLPTARPSHFTLLLPSPARAGTPCATIEARCCRRVCGTCGVQGTLAPNISMARDRRLGPRISIARHSDFIRVRE